MAQEGHTSIWVSKTARNGPFENAKKAVAAELGHEPTHDEILREVCAAYAGWDK
ncbi:hypothetical protein [Halogeometricum luteum]|uniref:Uncharacterized protein n=1 Tax=Halogeometricum luteum TaxID=2950537 RepID=A0ABU2GAG0_9EURY|nr:hypothetical protein [Halogeometricum sp. S3BR5-2]MDS0297113.1 hypothetical protein [Halogeometricum sp. S3BR5-2]